MGETFSLIKRGDIGQLKNKVLVAASQILRRHRVSQWRPSSLLTPAKLVYPPRHQEVGVFVHVYYSQYLPRIEKILAVYATTFPNVTFNFTSTDAKLHSSLLDLANQYSNVGLVRLCINRGRNFGPLLVSFQDEIKKFEYIVHVHTKLSLHANKKVGEKWADLLWGNLVENLDIFQNNLSLFREDRNFSLLYPIDLKLFPPSNFTWAHSREHVPTELAKASEGKSLEADRVPFPIGGMFMASSKGLTKSLLTRRWSTEDFPEELGQTDGTVQHALERVIGYLSWKGGAYPKEHIVLFPTLGAYTSDTSFCLADLNLKSKHT